MFSDLQLESFSTSLVNSEMLCQGMWYSSCILMQIWACLPLNTAKLWPEVFSEGLDNSLQHLSSADVVNFCWEAKTSTGDSIMLTAAIFLQRNHVIIYV